MHSRWFHAVIPLVVFTVALLSDRLVREIPVYADLVGDLPRAWQALVRYARWTVLIVLGLAIARVPLRRMAEEIGLTPGLWPTTLAWLVALVSSIPMLALGLGDLDPAPAALRGRPMPHGSGSCTLSS